MTENGGPAQTAINPQTKETVAFDGKSWSPVAGSKAPAPDKSALGYVDDAARSLAQGATFGFADEIAAAGNTLPLIGTGKSYKENLAAEKARNEQIPGAIKYPGEIAGAVAGTVAAAPAAGAAAAVTGAARLPALVRSILAGGAGGGLFGAGNADPGLANRATGAAEGMGFGAVAGGVLHPVIGALGSIAGGVRNAFTPQRQAAADLGRALTRDEMTPAQLAQAAAEAQAVRPGVATLADVGGENVRGLVERVAQTPGAGRTQVVPFMSDRQRMQASRLTADLELLLNGRGNAVKATEETIAARAEAAKPLYDQAMNFNARQVPEIVQAFQRETSTGFGQDVLRSKEFRNTLQTEYGISDPMQAPLMVVIDAWKKSVDDVSRSLARSGHNNSARVVGNMKDRLIGIVDQYNPAYAAAREAWAGPTQYLEALEQGRNIVKDSADDVRATLAGLSGSEREAYVTGALARIFRRMGDDAARLPDMTKYLRSPQMREKIAALMPTPEAAQKWNDRLNFEVKSSELFNRATGNSATARRLAEKDAADEIPAELVMDVFLGSPPAGFMRHFLTNLPTKVRDKVRSRSDQVLADMLLDPNAVGGAQLARILSAAGAQGAPSSVLRTAIPANATSSALEP